MTELPDNSGNENKLVLNSDTELTNLLREKEFTFKTAIQPVGANAARVEDNFGSIMDYDDNKIIAGTPQHIYDATGASPLGDAGAAWIFEKAAKNRAKKVAKKIKRSQTFSATGALQEFVIPENVNEITLKLWGAAGGPESSGTYVGGNGAFVKATILVNAGKTYNLIVGKAGILGGQTSAYGGGGYITAAGGLGGSGGGRTAFADALLGDMIVAAGGGGAGLDGNGGHGGAENGGDGYTNNPVIQAVDIPLDATGAKRAVQGQNKASDYFQYVLFGNNLDFYTNIANNVNYFNQKHVGGNASPANNVAGNVFGNGAGGAGFAGGAAGPDGYGYRTTMGGTQTLVDVNGSGSGGSSNIDLTPAFMPYNTEKPMIRDAFALAGDQANFAGSLATVGKNGNDGLAIVEWFEIVEEEIVDEKWTWTQTARLVPTGTNARAASTVFGTSVAIKGDWAFVGSPGNGFDATGANNLANAGTVWAFHKEGGQWVQKQRIVATGTNARGAGDLFGSNVEFDGTRLYVSAPGHAFDALGANSVAGAGAIFAYTFNGTTWGLSEKITASGNNARIAGDNFGYKFKVDNGTLVVASKNGYDSTGVNPVTNAGTVFIFEYNAGWQQVLRPIGPRTANALFGSSVDVKGTKIVIEGSGVAGSWIFDRVDGIWTNTSQSLDATTDEFLMQSSLAINSTTAITGTTGKGLTYASAVPTNFAGLFDTTNDLTDQYSMSLSGTNYVSYNSSTLFAASQSWTMDFWIYVNDANVASRSDNYRSSLVSRYKSWGIYSKMIDVEIGSGEIVLELTRQQGVVEFSVGRFPLRSWAHIAWVRDGDELRSYANGQLYKTYNITTFDFQELQLPIFFGYNAQAAQVNSLTYNARNFSVRNFAAYKNNFIPSVHFASVKNPNARGRGSSTYILDGSTILSGMPLDAPREVVMFDEAMDDISQARPDQQIPNSGYVEIKSFAGSEWKNVTASVVAPGLVNYRSAQGFGTSVENNGNFITVGAQNDRYGKNASRYKSGSTTGSVYAFDANDDFNFSRKIVSSNRSEAYTNAGFGASQAHDTFGNIYASELNFRDTVRVSSNFTYNYAFAPTSWRKYNSKSTSYWSVSGRVSKLGNVGGYIDKMSESLLDRKFYTSFLAHVNNVDTTAFVNATWSTSVPGFTYARALSYDIIIDDSNVMFYNDPTATNVNATWGNVATYGTVAQIDYNVASKNYTFTDLIVPGLANVDPRTNTGFGFKVKVVGDEIYASAPNANDSDYGFTNPLNSGSVYALKYDTVNLGWNVTRTIKPTVPTANDQFGINFDILDDRMVVRSNVTTDRASVFAQTGGTWTQTQTITGLGDGAQSDNTRFMGTNDLLAIGQFLNPEGIRTGVGKLETFTDSGSGTFTKDAQNYDFAFTGTQRYANDWFGHTLAIQGTRLAIGIPLNHVSTNGAVAMNNVGGAKVYNFDTSKWTYSATLVDDNENLASAYGSKLNMKGDMIVLQASSGTTGAMRVWTNTAGSWTVTPQLTAPAGSSTNSSVIFNTTTIVQGATTVGPATSVSQGTTGAFKNLNKVGQNWTPAATYNFTPLTTTGAYEQGTIAYNNYSNTLLGRNQGDTFGLELKLSDDKNILLVSSTGHSYRTDPTSAAAATGIGAVFSYYMDTNTNQWRLNTKVNAVAPIVGAQFGRGIEKANANEYLISSYASGNRGDFAKFTATPAARLTTWAQNYLISNTTVSENFAQSIAWDSGRQIYYIGTPGRIIAGNGSGSFETVTDSSDPTRGNNSFDGIINNRTSNDQFGYSVSVFNGHLAVGVPGYEYNYAGTVAGSLRGGVYTYKVSDEGYFSPEAKLTFETKTTNSHGYFVGINDDTLAVYSTTSKPVLFKQVDDVWVEQTVNASASTSITANSGFHSYAWDQATGTTVTAAITGTFNVPNTIATLGGAITTDFNGTDWNTASQGILSKTVNADGVISESQVLLSSATTYGKSGFTLSSDGQYLAIGSNDPYYLTGPTGMTGAFQGKVFIYRWDATLSKFAYLAVVNSPAGFQLEWGNSISWVGDELVINANGRMLVHYAKTEDNHFYVKKVSNMEGATSSAILSLEGNALIMANPTSNGYPNVTNSGAIHTKILNDGIWGSSRGIHAGADADEFSTSVIGAGGGGAGYVGGKAASSFSFQFGAFGGSNLLPEGATEITSIGTTRANASDANALGGGASDMGTDGENARIVINGQVFDYTGFDQLYVVDENTTELEVQLWGAGGGSAITTSYTDRRTGRGGAGAYVGATIPVTPGDILTLVVGAGGATGGLQTDLINREQQRRYGFGGIGSISSTATLNNGACGGGLAGIMLNGEYVAIAAGGGGGSTRPTNSLYAFLDGMPGGYTSLESPSFIYTGDDFDLVVAPGIINSRMANDNVGYSVKVVNDHMVLVGAPRHAYSDNGDKLPVGSGVVGIYKKYNGKWELNKKLTSSKSASSDRFGLDLSLIDGKLAVLGGFNIQPSDINGAFANILDNISRTVVETFTFDGENFTSTAKISVTGENASRSVALVGDNLVIGTPRRDTDGVAGSVTDSGGLNTYDSSLALLGITIGGGVTHGRFASDLFGTSVAITPTQIIAGAPGHNYGPNGSNQRNGQGALFVFDKMNSVWGFRAKLNLETNSSLLGYGTSLKLIGDRLYAGVSDLSKKVELTQDQGNWTISKHIDATASKIAEVVAQNKLIELDPTSAIGIGSQPNIVGAGRAKTFTIGNDGTLTDALQDYTIPGNSNGRASNDQFGYSVYANHDFVVVGAPNHAADVVGNTIAGKKGALFVFNKTGEEWKRETKIVADSSATTGFGQALTGRNGWIMSSGSAGGLARVFQRTAEGIWVAKHDFTGTAGDAFGASLTMADTGKFAVGIPLGDGNPPEVLNLRDSGIVQTYSRASEVYTDTGILSAQGLSHGRNEGDWFGYSIAANKRYLVIGSPHYSYDALGNVEVSQAGAIWIFLRQGTKYPLVGKYVNPTRTENGLFGSAVGIDEKTNRIVVGEPGTQSVFAFGFDGETLTLDQTITIAEEGFGSVLSVSGGKLAIGSEHAEADAGVVRVYQLDNNLGQWNLTETIEGFSDKDGNAMVNGHEAGDLFGAAVALDPLGSIIIGSPGHDYNAVGADPVTDAGAVFLKKV